MIRIPINKEIREYREKIFWGLTLRQAGFSVAAIAAAVGTYFLLNPYFNSEIVSWCVIFASVPFWLLGYFQYNGMPAEKVLAAWFRSSMLMPKRLLYKPTNIWMEICADSIETATKEEIPFYD